MAGAKKVKTIKEINERIKQGKAVVVTADEMTDIVKRKGSGKAFKEVDVVTTGTFAPMCSSGAFINFGHTKPAIRASKVWLNDVPAYGGLAAVDTYIGATEPVEDDPLNRIHPGQFKYGGGHVIHDLLAGKKIKVKATSYGTDCYPNREAEKRINLADLPYAMLLNPRNGYQNYNCAINTTKKTIYTYMGVMKPRLGNANYSTSGQLSPLFNDPYYLTWEPESFWVAPRVISSVREPSITPWWRGEKMGYPCPAPEPSWSRETSRKWIPSGWWV